MLKPPIKKQNLLSVTSVLEVALCGLIAIIPLFEENTYHEIQYIVSGILGICVILLLREMSQIRQVDIPILSVLFLVLIIKSILNFRHRFDIGECEILVCMFLLCLWLSIQKHTRIFSWIFIALSFQGVVQVVLSVLQVCGTVQSFNNDFKVTGTFLNPGPLGIFLVLPCIYLFHQCYSDRIKTVLHSRVIIVLLWLFLALGIVLSGSRTAWIAILVPSVLYLKGLGSWKRYVPLGVMAFVLLVWIRPESVFARLHIWRVSAFMFLHQGLWGVGTGGFSAEFMSSQASLCPPQTIVDNGYAFNEFLAYICEQGIVGLVLLSIFVYFCVCDWREQGVKRRFSSCISIAFLICCLSSYPLEIVSLKMQSVVIVSYFACNSRWNITVKTAQWVKIVYVSICLLLVGLIITSSMVRLFYNRQIDRYCQFRGEGISLDNKMLKAYLLHDSRLLSLLSLATNEVGDDRLCVEATLRFMCYRQTPSLALRMGESYEAMQQPQKALSWYKTAQKLNPNLLRPRYAEFSLLRKMRGDTTYLRRYALLLLQHKNKVENAETRNMKREIQEYLIIGIQNELEHLPRKKIVLKKKCNE